MRRATQSLFTAILILVAGFTLAGCHGGTGELRYVNRTNSAEVLTLNHFEGLKTKLISTVHGVSMGSYTLKTDNGTSSGTFTIDQNGFKFKSDDGKTDTVKTRADGSFDYAHVTWELAPVVKEVKSLKALASSSK